MFFKKKIVVTHSGDFHADDAFSVATFSLLHAGKIKVIRSRDPEDWARGDYVVDVGDVYDHSRCRYDHHQRGGAGARPDGVPYAGFGLVWKHYGALVCGSQTVADKVERLLVEPIDAGDNGFPIAKQLIPIREYPLADAIGAFRGSENGADAEYADFMKASEWARGVLSREIARCKSAVADTEKVRSIYEKSSDRRVVVMDEELFWAEALRSTPDALFAVYPDSTGKWRVKVVQEEGFKARKNLPESWAGLRDDALVRATGVPDAEFSHAKRFMAVARSREGALALAKKALEA
jgi:uncharacterized UPF0160 family protein